MQQSEKAAAEAEAERSGGLGLKGQRSIVELQLFDSLSQIAVTRSVCGIDTRIDHRQRALEARKRLGCAALGECYRIPDARLADCLYRSGEISDVSRLEARPLVESERRHHSDRNDLKLAAGTHHAYAVARLYRTVEYADINNDTEI